MRSTAARRVGGCLHRFPDADRGAAGRVWSRAGATSTWWRAPGPSRRRHQAEEAAPDPLVGSCAGGAGAARRGFAPEEPPPDGYVFGPELIHRVRSTWKAVRDEARLPELRLHDLRHAYASVLASGGLSLPIIGALLGHTTPTTTARYAHLLDDPLRQATERVGSLWQSLSNGTSGEVVPFRSGGQG